ncbi:hypothetical protein [Anaerovorax sp. IOR16]|uniref:hypothetical protein n=1 Tax=Anaerovorax sp. IOR16 TaxID=2773458 RepID=UPI0019D06B13|nr:hypothetical protein [Anaerovorax sp. IOR16]
MIVKEKSKILSINPVIAVKKVNIPNVKEYFNKLSIFFAYMRKIDQKITKQPVITVFHFVTVLPINITSKFPFIAIINIIMDSINNAFFILSIFLS